MLNSYSGVYHNCKHIPPADRRGGKDNTAEDDEPPAAAVWREVVDIGRPEEHSAALLVDLDIMKRWRRGGRGGERARILEGLVYICRVRERGLRPVDVRLVRPWGVHRRLRGLVQCSASGNGWEPKQRTERKGEREVPVGQLLRELDSR